MAKRPRYGWKDKRIGGDPTIVARHLHGLERKYGILDAAVVVEDARDAESPLHRYFQWDNNVAAEEYRLEQARRLLRAVVMDSPARPNETIRAFLMVETDSAGGYVNTVRAMSDVVLREQVLARARTELKAFKTKYAHLRELAAVIAAIEEVA